MASFNEHMHHGRERVRTEIGPDGQAQIAQAAAGLREMFIAEGLPWNDDTIRGAMFALVLAPTMTERERMQLIGVLMGSLS